VRVSPLKANGLQPDQRSKIDLAERAELQMHNSETYEPRSKGMGVGNPLMPCENKRKRLLVLAADVVFVASKTPFRYTERLEELENTKTK